MNGPEIDADKLREDGLDYATDQLRDAALVVKGLFNLRESSIEIIQKHGALTAVIAVLAHLDERAEERHILKETELEELRRMADSVEIAVGCMMQLIIGEQKERWIDNHPRHTEVQLKEAMDFYDSVAIRASGIKYDKK
jgi:hypothetical protein